MTDRMQIGPAEGIWVVRADGAVIAESRNALELRETGHDRVIYFPRADVAMAFVEASPTRTHCPHKGDASYFHIAASNGRIADAAWCYDAPVASAQQIGGHLAFDAAKVTVERL